MSEDETPDFRDAPIPPGNRGFWLGAVTILIVGTVGVGGQLIGFRAIDALSKAQIRLEAVEDEERQLRLELPRLATERDLLKNEHSAAEDLVETRKAHLERLALKIEKTTRDLEKEQSILAVVKGKVDTTTTMTDALDKQKEDLEASLRDLTSGVDAKTAAIKERRRQEAQLDANREENRALYGLFKEDREELAKDLERLRSDRDAVEIDLSNRRKILQSMDSDIEANQERIILQQQAVREWESKSAELAQIRANIEAEVIAKTKLKSEKEDLDIEVARLQSNRNTLIEQMEIDETVAKTKRDLVAEETTKLQTQKSALLTLQQEIARLGDDKKILENEISRLQTAESIAGVKLRDADRKFAARDEELKATQGRIETANSLLEETESRSAQLRSKTLEGIDQALQKLVDFVNKLENLESSPSSPKQAKPLEDPAS